MHHTRAVAAAPKLLLRFKSVCLHFKDILSVFFLFNCNTRQVLNIVVTFDVINANRAGGVLCLWSGKCVH